MKLRYLGIIALSTLQAHIPFLELSTSSWADDTLRSLTLRQKIGQLLVVAATSSSRGWVESLAALVCASPYTIDQTSVLTFVKQYHVGGVIFLYKSDPERQMALTQIYQNNACIPLLIVQDCEWGLSMRLDKEAARVVQYPRNLTLAAIDDEDAVYRLGKEIGNQCRALGIHMNCAPVMDINNNPLNRVIHDRSFGDDKERVARLGVAYARGLQDAGVLACAKHFPGHGDTHVDSHHALPVIPHDRERITTFEYYPFKKSIEQGVAAIMSAHLAIPSIDPSGAPASMSYTMVTQELKENLNFEGLVVTDGLGMRAITNQYAPGDLELQAFLAGNDILLCPVDIPAAIDRIEQAVRSGNVSEAELDRRVLKILKAKEWAFEQNNNNPLIQNALGFLVRPQAYALQQELYQRALTLVRGDLLNPAQLDHSLMLLVGTRGCTSENSPYTNVGNYCKKLSSGNVKKYCAQAQAYDHVIIGVGSLTKDVSNRCGISPHLATLCKKLKNNGKKVTVIVFGTPYSIPFLSDADTVLVAYEDVGAAHAAIASFLRGEYEPQGVLPVRLP
jgi:beta-glucosidase-like glycosyl hydrolase